jgi:ATP-dependent RNA helicase DHX8/PRP22
MSITCIEKMDQDSFTEEIGHLSITDETCRPRWTPGQAQVAMDCLLEDMKRKQSACIESIEVDVQELKIKLSSHSRKKVALYDFHRLKAERELIEYSIEESRLRKEVFVKCCLEYQAKLEDLISTEHVAGAFEEVHALRAGFEREVKRYDKALPIYAHRLNIIEMIEQHQVSIVIGETGSGKSTQLVQYLQEARYAANGLIVCTQPRKLAAISLAEHVSAEVNEQVGDTYGYHVAAKSERSAMTKVLYMTDHTLLNECIADPTLSKYSCLVIDEAHERSIHTDILIAFIKRCLPNRQDLKVVITSATINPKLFSTYFGGPHICPVIEVPGRTYPVDVMWDRPEGSIVDRDYVSEAVNKVHEIHITKRGATGPGDILVFLTSPAEIERACTLAKETLKNEAEVLPLHGKLQPEDQKKVFIPTEKGKRKVVFSTNVAETSVTIPGIVYVIDTGLAKELCYDSKKNMNSLEIRPISKSSADQRKGRAGRTCPGECYRLYSEEDYSDMRDASVPEILRITLAFAVIKLYEFGIEDIHSFEFVESPDRKALDDAIENLKFLGAIEDGKLTKLGKEMALLPLDPNLSKVLFDGIKKGVGAEAAAAVAISTLAGRVFFRPTTAESQEESNMKRLPFCQQSGDQMTYLHTYFQWSLEEWSDRNKWCVENYVNAKSMRMVQHTVDELRFILKQKHIFTIPGTIESLDKADKILPKLFFDAFLRNMCIHLGHNQVGYWSERLPEEQLVIHYGSSLHYLSSTPQCVVYEKTQKTSQHFLLQALPVREEWIQEAIESGKLLCHPAENDLLQFYQVAPLSFTNLGPSLSLKFQHKFPQFRRAYVPEFSHLNVQPVFEHFKEQGVFTVYAQKYHHERVEESVTYIIQSVKKELLDETRQYGITGDYDDVKITIGCGGCIQRIMMPGDFQTIVVRGLKEPFLNAAQQELMKYGDCTPSVNRNPRGTQLFVKFENPGDAVKALQHKFTSFEDPSVRIQNYRENRNQIRLELEWCRRPRRDIAFINIEEKDASFFESNIRPLFHRGNRFSMVHGLSGLKFQPQRDKCSLRVTGIRFETTEEKVKSALQDLIDAASQMPFSVFFTFEKEFEETDEMYTRRRDYLDASLSRCTPRVPKNQYYVDFFRPRPKNVNYKALVCFNDSASCMRMLKHLRENEVAYTVKVLLSSRVRYQAQVFSVIKPTIEEVSRHYSTTSSTVSIKYDDKDKWGNTFVTMAASDINAFTGAREVLADAVAPEVLRFTDCKESQYVSTTNFQVVTREIQARTSTYIKISASSLSTSSIAIHGTQENREAAKDEVQLHLQAVMQNGVECFEVNLKAYDPGLMKHLVGEYGSDLARLPDAFDGVTATRLNPRRQLLTLFATKAGYDTFLLHLDAFMAEGITEQAQVFSETQTGIVSECCVCFETHDSKNRKTFFYRLEYCGHVYCKECIQQQLEATSIEFPVTCAADKCEEQLVWRDFENLFKDKVKDLRDITAASLKSYIARNTDKVRNCITPDCDMMYVSSSEGKRFVCRQCGANICTQCHTTWHEGYDSCAAYKNRNSTTSGDAELKMWMNSDRKNRKNCPKCSAPIEKNKGCQHMICSQCRVNICWECLEYFVKSGDCYDHLTTKHGGAFGREAGGIQFW